ncbi:hypothetical protein RJ640_023344, partial [Escallonia rubra]
TLLVIFSLFLPFSVPIVQARLSRMDAAVDAMIPFGFSEKTVRKSVKTLLNEYGGDEGWPFIEADAYNVLLETILGEQEKSQQEGDVQEYCAERDNLLENGPLQDEGSGNKALVDTAGPSIGTIQAICSEATNTALEAETTGDKEGSLLAEGDGEGCQTKELVCAANSIDRCSEGAMLLLNAPVQTPTRIIPSPPPTDSIPTRKNKPNYGWISSDDEEDNLVILSAASVRFRPPTPRQLETLAGGTETGKKRKSRWDVRPENV